VGSEKALPPTPTTSPPRPDDEADLLPMHPVIAIVNNMTQKANAFLFI
jgi:hypothetical protein